MKRDRFSDPARSSLAGVVVSSLFADTAIHAPKALTSSARPTSNTSRLFRLGVLTAALCGMVATSGCSTRSTDTRQKSQSQDLASTAASSRGQAAPVKAKPEKPKIAPPLRGLEGAHFSVYDLLVNRPLAHRIAFADTAPTLVVDATTPDFVRYIHGNHTKDWLLGAKLEKKGAAGIKARKASLWVPALRADTDQQLRMRVYNPAKWKNRLSVKFNGKALEPAELEEGWQEVVFSVPAGSELRGDNQIDLAFSNMGRIKGKLSGGAIAWVELGPTRPDEIAEEDTKSEKSDSEKPQTDAAGIDTNAKAQHAAGDEVVDNEATKNGAESAENESAKDDVAEKKAGDEESDVETVSLAAAALKKESSMPLKQGTLTVDAQSGMAWYVWVPENAQLALDLSAPEACGVDFGLYVEDPQSETGIKKATSVTRELVKGRGEEQKTAIDLSKWAEQVARVELRASDGCGPEQQVEIRAASLVVSGERPSVPEGVKPPKYVLFWMVDTLREDHLPLDFETNVKAPNFVKLAKQGAHFKLAYVQGNESRTSHAALFTGQYPNKNGLVGKGILRPKHYLFSEAIQDFGYQTGIHVANGYVSKTGGFGQGWDYYVNNLREGWGINADDITRHGLKWVSKNADKPFFLYLGTIDPHVTYRAHEGITEQYEKTPYSGRYKNYISGKDLGAIKGGQKVSKRDRTRIQNLYKGEITFNDKAFGDLRAGLEEAGLWKDTMVIITADHGDEFWEHGSVGHGHNIHQELVHVPLIMYYPRLIPEETVVSAGVDIIDIYPTILDALGAERPDDLQGKSLIPLIHHTQGGYPEPAIATQYLIHYAMQMQQWKLYLKRGSYEIYDRNADPLELKDVHTKHPLASRWLLDSMGYFRAHRKQWNKQTWGVASNVKPGFVDFISAE